MTHDDHAHDHVHETGSAICPVCRMAVDPDRSPSGQFQGQTYYFCNEKCERAFLKNPGKFAQRAREA
jgi:Cu+-exporting ATPase